MKRPVTRVSPGPAQQALFAEIPADPDCLEIQEAPRASFIDPSPEQLSIGPQSLRTYLTQARQVGAFAIRKLVRSANYEKFLARYQAKGRAPYHPALMVGLILFALLRGRRSLRGIEACARENVSAWWLTGGACPDHASIGRFVARFGDLLAGSFFEQLTSRILEQTGASGTDVAGDGTTIPSMASRFGLIREEVARAKAEELREKAAGLDGDASETLRSDLEEEAERYERAAEAAQREVKRAGRSAKSRSVQVALSDPHATNQRLKNGFPAPSYKPTIFANQERIVVAHDVQASSENEAVAGLCAQAKRVSGKDQLDTVRLDAGFFSGEVLQTLLEQEVENPLVADKGVKGELRKQKPRKQFPKSAFEYDHESDTYRCPAGKTLKCVKHRRVRKTKLYGGAPCSECPLRDQCTTAKKGRQIHRYEVYDPLKDAMRAVLDNPLARADYRKRSAMVEPVFADLRQCQGFVRFLRAGLSKVRVEFGLHVLAHNVGRFLALTVVAAGLRSTARVLLGAVLAWREALSALLVSGAQSPRLLVQTA